MLARYLLQGRAVAQAGLPSGRSAGHRHVPPHAPHRAGGAVLALILLAVALATPHEAAAEGRAGSAAQIIRSTDLRKRADDEAPSLGRLPRGTIVSIAGEVKNGYVKVEVELEEGSVTGWVPRETLNRQTRETLPSDPRSETEQDEDRVREKKRSDEPDDDESQIIRPRSRIRVPKDEGLLLRREPTFFYGVQAGGGLAIVKADAVTTNLLFGPSITAGAHLGYYFTRALPLRLEVNYQLSQGSDASNNNIAVGFIDTSLSLSYFIDDFELFGGASWAYGISVSNLPTAIVNNAAADFSSIYVHGGLGYRFPLGEVTFFVLRVRYNISFQAAPANIENVVGMGYLEFRG